MTEEQKEQSEEFSKTPKPPKEKDWDCPLCGKSYNKKYKYVHMKICLPKKKRSPSRQEVKDVAKAVEKLEKKVAEQEATIQPPKLEELPEAKPELLSSIMEHHEEGEEPGSIDEIVEDPRINFYLQIAIVIGIVVAALFVGYKAVFNGGQQQEVVYQEPVDMGFTDQRGVYYGPGEYHH